MVKSLLIEHLFSRFYEGDKLFYPKGFTEVQIRLPDDKTLADVQLQFFNRKFFERRGIEIDLFKEPDLEPIVIELPPKPESLVLEVEKQIQIFDGSTNRGNPTADYEPFFRLSDHIAGLETYGLNLGQILAVEIVFPRPIVSMYIGRYAGSFFTQTGAKMSHYLRECVQNAIRNNGEINFDYNDMQHLEILNPASDCKVSFAWLWERFIKNLNDELYMRNMLNASRAASAKAGNKEIPATLKIKYTAVK